jgi:hypothetical protein
MGGPCSMNGGEEEHIEITVGKSQMERDHYENRK